MSHKPLVHGLVFILSVCLTAGCAELDEPQLLPAATDYPADVAAGPAALRKLTREQYINAVVDLLGPELEVPPTAEPDAVLSGLAAVGAGGTSYSPRGVESFEQVAYALAAQALSLEAIRARLVPCTPSESVDSACAEAVLSPLARRAWRRPPLPEEIDGLVGVSMEAAKALGSFDGGLEFGIAAILQSPHFLYRTELGATDGGLRRFTDHELAMRLSFLLWNGPPDEALLAAADAGELTTDDGLVLQAERLLADDRARAGLRRFFTEWLQLSDLTSLSKDPTIFDFYTNELGESAREETLRLLEWMVFDEGRDLRTLMTTTTTFVSPLLAALYDIPAPSADDGFVRVQLPQDGHRAGLLGHASFLNQHAHAVSTSVTLRGKAVRSILLCQAMPDPPVNVDTSIPEPSGDAPTMRERVAEHLTDPGCAGCHLLMDPIGLGLERFDGTGRFRNLDNFTEIDPSGDLDGEVFSTARGLGRLIGQHPDFSKCVVRTLARYAMGRTETVAERGHIKALDARFREAGFRLAPLLVELVQSPLFLGVGAPLEAEAGGGQ